MRNTTALRGVYGADRLRSERVWLTEVSACELGQDSKRARLGGAGAWLPILRILDQSLLTAIIGDEAGHVFHPQTVPGDMSPSWPLLFTTTAQHTTKKSANSFTAQKETTTPNTVSEQAVHEDPKKIKLMGYMTSLAKTYRGKVSDKIQQLLQVLHQAITNLLE